MVRIYYIMKCCLILTCYVDIYVILNVDVYFDKKGTKKMLKKNIFSLFMVMGIFVLMLVSCNTKAEETMTTTSNNVKEVKEEELKKAEEEKVLKEEKKVYDPNQKVAFLTFDDGPSKNTEKILDILKSENVKATFFVNGHEDEFAKKMYKRIVDEGHTIANHTYSHSYKDVYRSQESFIEDVDKLNKYIESMVKVKVDIIRFPGGSNNHINRKYAGVSDNSFMEGLAQRMEDEGYVYFDWTVDSTDASKAKQSVEKIKSSTISESLNQKYPIVLFHDAPAKTTTVEALPEVIKTLKDNDYLIDNLTKDAPVKSRFLKGDHGETLK